MFNTIDIVPDSIRSDPQVIAACGAIDKELAEIYEGIPSISFWPNIEKQSGAMLDLLAWEMHVDVWQGWEGDLTNEQKIRLINQSIDWHRHKGTKYAVQQMCNNIFKYSEVQEWYEYGGTPYHFRVLVSDDLANPIQVQSLTDAIIAVKNVRSWLDGLIRIATANTTVYVGCAMGYVKLGLIRITR